MDEIVVCPLYKLTDDRSVCSKSLQWEENKSHGTTHGVGKTMVAYRHPFLAFLIPYSLDTTLNLKTAKLWYGEGTISDEVNPGIVNCSYFKTISEATVPTISDFQKIVFAFLSLRLITEDLSFISAINEWMETGHIKELDVIDMISKYKSKCGPNVNTTTFQAFLSLDTSISYATYCLLQAMLIFKNSFHNGVAKDSLNRDIRMSFNYTLEAARQKEMANDFSIHDILIKTFSMKSR